MSDFIPQMQPWFGEEEAEAMDRYMRSGGFLMEFKQTQEFEARIAEYVGVRHAITFNNGTISLTAAAIACGLESGDEVLVPNYTMIATPNSVKMIGCKPVFVDVCSSTLCMDLESAKKAISNKTKAILFVNANGRYPKEGIAVWASFAQEHGLILIEDAAQALGSTYPDGRHMGTVGTVGSFSFSVPKIISTGQGGMLVTQDDALARAIRKLKDFGRSGGGNDIHDTIGWNFKFTDMQAVVGNQQMKKLPWRVERKKEIYKRYQKKLAQVSQVSFFYQDLEYTTPWFIDILAYGREELCLHLKERGIGVRVMYPPIHRQKCYNEPGMHPVSQKVGKEGLWLPSSSQLKDADVDRVCNEIAAFYGVAL